LPEEEEFMRENSGKVGKRESGTYWERKKSEETLIRQTKRPGGCSMGKSWQKGARKLWALGRKGDRDRILRPKAA